MRKPEGPREIRKTEIREQKKAERERSERREKEVREEKEVRDKRGRAPRPASLRIYLPFLYFLTYLPDQSLSYFQRRIFPPALSIS